MNKVLSISILLFVASNLYSQEYIQFSQYVNAQGVLNPAYTGTKSLPSGFLLYRNQWVNIDGAPVTFAFNINTPIKGKNMGIGLSAVNEQIGMRKQTEFNAAYSYITKINSKSNLSFGLQVGIKNNFFDKSNAQATDLDDPFLTDQKESFLLPNFGFGAYYYTKRFFAGLSLPNMLTNRLDLQSAALKTKGFSFKDQHFYMFSGYVIKLKEKLLLKPSVLVKYLYGAPLQLNINSSLLIQDALGLGLGYRTGDALIFLVDFKINTQIRVGYSYDLGMNNLNSYNFGSHEIMLMFNVNNNSDLFNSPRKF